MHLFCSRTAAACCRSVMVLILPTMAPGWSHSMPAWCSPRGRMMLCSFRSRSARFVVVGGRDQRAFVAAIPRPRCPRGFSKKSAREHADVPHGEMLPLLVTFGFFGEEADGHELFSKAHDEAAASLNGTRSALVESFWWSGSKSFEGPGAAFHCGNHSLDIAARRYLSAADCANMRMKLTCEGPPSSRSYHTRAKSCGRGKHTHARGSLIRNTRTRAHKHARTRMPAPTPLSSAR